MTMYRHRDLTITSIDTAGPRAVSSQFDAQGEMPIIQIEFQKSECIICKLT